MRRVVYTYRKKLPTSKYTCIIYKNNFILYIIYEQIIMKTFKLFYI